MTEQRVVILGPAWVDEVRDAGGVRASVTGDAVELAIALRGDGLALTVVAPVAGDADGERIRRALEDRGIRLVTVPAPEGTPRHSIVRDRSGTLTEPAGESAAFSDTRRSLAAQAEADLIVDLRDREVTTLAEERADVLQALGLGGAGHPPTEAGSRAVAGTASAAADDAPFDSPMSAPAAAAPTLLPAPIVAGTYRHAPVRLIPEAPVAHAPAPDWHGLEARLNRLGT